MRQRIFTEKLSIENSSGFYDSNRHFLLSNRSKTPKRYKYAVIMFLFETCLSRHY